METEFRYNETLRNEMPESRTPGSTIDEIPI